MYSIQNNNKNHGKTAVKNIKKVFFKANYLAG